MLSDVILNSLYLTDWNNYPKVRIDMMNKLWPGWDSTLKQNEVKHVTSIGKFKALQLSIVVANFSFEMHH